MFEKGATTAAFVRRGGDGTVKRGGVLLGLMFSKSGRKMRKS